MIQFTFYRMANRCNLNASRSDFLAVPLRDGLKDLTRFSMLTYTVEVPGRFGQKVYRDHRYDVPNVADRADVKPVLTDLPEIYDSKEIDQGLLNAPHSRDKILVLLRL